MKSEAVAVEPLALSRDQQRSRRKRVVRAKTLGIKGMRKRDLEEFRALYPDDGHKIPRCREECSAVPRPCPYVSCKFHLYFDVNKRGGLKYNFPDLEPEDLHESCSLDVADRGGETLENVGALLNLTRERVRQIEQVAIKKLVASGALERDNNG